GDESLGLRARGDLVECGLRGRLVLGVAVVQRGREALVLRARPVRLDEEALQLPSPGGRVWIELEPVVADVDELRHADDAPRFLAGASADAGNQRVARVETA